ncbi:protein TE13 [Testudinid alphaherpesvirus 3]|nr:protein TE13 [Testudinid alphaherpesvirus 3]
MKGVSFLICLLEFLSCYATIAPDDEKWPVCDYGPDELLASINEFGKHVWWYDSRLSLAKTFDWYRAVKLYTHEEHHYTNSQKMKIPSVWCGDYMNPQLLWLDSGGCSCISSPFCGAAMQPYFYMYLEPQNGDDYNFYRLYVSGYQVSVRNMPCGWSCGCINNHTLDRYYLLTGQNNIFKGGELQLSKFLACYMSKSFSYTAHQFVSAVYSIKLPCKSECVMFANGNKTLVTNCTYAQKITWDLIVISPNWNKTLELACRNSTEKGGTCVFMHGQYLGVTLKGKSCFGYVKEVRGRVLSTCAKMTLIPQHATVPETQNYTFASTFKWMVGTPGKVYTTAKNGTVHVNKYPYWNANWQDKQFEGRTFTNYSAFLDRKIGLTIIKLTPNDSYTYDFEVLQSDYIRNPSDYNYISNPWDDYRYYPQPVTLTVQKKVQRCDIFFPYLNQTNTTCVQGNPDVIAFDPHRTTALRDLLYLYTNRTRKVSMLVFGDIVSFNFTNRLCFDANESDYCKRTPHRTVARFSARNHSITYNNSQVVRFHNDSADYWQSLAKSVDRAWLMLSNTTFSSWALDLLSLSPETGPHTLYTLHNFTSPFNVTAAPQQCKLLVYAYNLTLNKNLEYNVTNVFLYTSDKRQNSTV